MEQVFPNLYVGNDNDAVKALESGKFYVLSTCKDGPNGHRSVLKYTTAAAPKGKNYLIAEDGEKHLALNLVDSDDPNFIPHEVINVALKFINKHLTNGEKVLVHCNQGQSRSPSIVMLYLKSIGELPERYWEAFKIFKTLYSHFNPGIGMEQYLKSNWRKN